MDLGVLLGAPVSMRHPLRLSWKAAAEYRAVTRGSKRSLLPPCLSTGHGLPYTCTVVGSRSFLNTSGRPGKPVSPGMDDSGDLGMSPWVASALCERSLLECAAGVFAEFPLGKDLPSAPGKAHFPGSCFSSFTGGGECGRRCGVLLKLAGWRCIPASGASAENGPLIWPETSPGFHVCGRQTVRQSEARL